MNHKAKVAILAGAALVALVSGGAALADVKAGVDAWTRGDYAAAVHQWQGPADAGDPDAMFNLAQAYRLGRGVPEDMAKAEALYAKAASEGHIQAADTYGLMLFQEGRHEAALPYIEAAAKRGDPRSEYLLGIASFNGDFVQKDWVKAYALLSMANSQGLPQAISALAQMDQNIPLAQRQQGAALAVEMQKDADATRGRELAAADLGTGVTTRPAKAPVARPAPRSAARTSVSPSIAAALAAVAEARQATGTESPANAGASFVRRRSSVPPLAVAAPTPKLPSPSPRPATSEPRAKPVTEASNGPWKVQLGAFSIRGNVDRLWAQVSGRSELAGKTKIAVPTGSVTKLLAGGFASRDAADSACRALKSAGHECLVTR